MKWKRNNLASCPTISYWEQISTHENNEKKLKNTREKSPAHFVTNYSECLRCVTNDVIAWLSSCQCINFVAVQLQSRSSASNLLALCNGRWCVGVFTNIVLLVFRDLIWGMIMLNRGVLVLSLALVCSAVAHPHSMYDEVAANMPAPFTRVLFLKKPPLEGKQIYSHAVQRLPTYSNKEVGVHNSCYGRTWAWCLCNKMPFQQLQCGIQLPHATIESVSDIYANLNAI